MGVWCINLLASIGAIDLNNMGKYPDGKAKRRFSLLEFGPGRGTLMVDIIRVNYNRIIAQNKLILVKGSSPVQSAKRIGNQLCRV